MERAIKSEETSGRFQIVADINDGDINSEEIINIFELLLRLDLHEK